MEKENSENSKIDSLGVMWRNCFKTGEFFNNTALILLDKIRQSRYFSIIQQAC